MLCEVLAGYYPGIPTDAVHQLFTRPLRAGLCASRSSWACVIPFILAGGRRLAPPAADRGRSPRVLALIGIFVHRANLIVIGLGKAPIPLPPGTPLGIPQSSGSSFATSSVYFPSVWEFLIVIGIVALAALVVHARRALSAARGAFLARGRRGHRRGDGGGESAAGSPLGRAGRAPGRRLRPPCRRLPGAALGLREPTAAYLDGACLRRARRGSAKRSPGWAPTAPLYEPALSALSRGAAAAADLCRRSPPAWPPSTPACSPAPAARLCLLRLAVSRRRDRRPPRLNGAAAAYAAAAYDAEGVAFRSSAARASRSRRHRARVSVPPLPPRRARWQRRRQRRGSAGCARALDSFLREHAARFFGEFAARRAWRPTTCDLYGGLGRAARRPRRRRARPDPAAPATVAR